MVDHARIRVTLFKNCQNPQNGQDVLLNPHAAREEIYELCSNTLGIQAAKVFSDSGFLLNNFNSLRDGAVLYVSQGEHFQVRQPAATPGTGSRKYSLVMLGTAAVGKSAITLRYQTNKFCKDYDPTITDQYNKNAVVDGVSSQVTILDTAGMEDYYPLIDEWIDKKNGIVLVFSVELPDSLQKLRFFYEKVMYRYAHEPPVIVVVANKIDLPVRAVSTEEGRRFAEELGVRYFEVSAANDVNIEELFSHIVRELRQRETKRAEPRRRWWNCSLL